MKNQPVRILPGNAKPFEPFWKVVNKIDSQSGENEIQFYGVISEYSWMEDDITPALFRKDLASLGGQPVTLRIHSVGGDAWAASAIRAMIMDYPGKVTARIDGVCASAATIVATAADHVKMQDTAFFMIHNPWSIAIGYADDMKKVASFLDTTKDGILDAYVNKTGMDREVLSRMMDRETWLTSHEALADKFVDEVINGPVKNLTLQDAGAAAPVLNALMNFQNVPSVLIEKDEAAGAENEEAKHLRDYVQIFYQGE